MIIMWIRPYAVVGAGGEDHGRVLHLIQCCYSLTWVMPAPLHFPKHRIFFQAWLLLPLGVFLPDYQLNKYQINRHSNFDGKFYASLSALSPVLPCLVFLCG